MTAPASGSQRKCFKKAGDDIRGFYGLYPSNIEEMNNCECPSSCPLSVLDSLPGLLPDSDVCTAQEINMILSKICKGCYWQSNVVIIIFYDSNTVR